MRVREPMRRWRADAGAVVLVLALAVSTSSAGFLVAAHRAEAAEVKPPHRVDGRMLQDTTRHLMCMCGCNLTVSSCRNSMTCEIAARMTDEATTMLGRGQSRAQVLEVFARDYGEQILAAPTRSGFNLTAWILPFIALAAGATFVLLALATWRSRRPGPAPQPVEMDPRYTALVEAEVREGM